jgi:hypothetical protein
MMFLIEMPLDLLQLIALHMDQLSALFTFAVKADIRLDMAFLPHVFKAGRAGCINDIFIDYPFIHEVFQLTVNSGLPDILALGLKILTYIICGNMTGSLFQISQERIPLFCFIL